MTRRRVRYRPPPPRKRPSWCATIAQQSADLGSLQAVFDRRDAERAAKAATAAARAREAQEAVRVVAWRTAEHQAYRAWLAAPLDVPQREPWPEEADEQGDPVTCRWSKCQECAALLRFVRRRRP